MSDSEGITHLRSALTLPGLQVNLLLLWYQLTILDLIVIASDVSSRRCSKCNFRKLMRSVWWCCTAQTLHDVTNAASANITTVVIVHCINVILTLIYEIMLSYWSGIGSIHSRKAGNQWFSRFCVTALNFLRLLTYQHCKKNKQHTVQHTSGAFCLCVMHCTTICKLDW